MPNKTIKKDIKNNKLLEKEVDILRKAIEEQQLKNVNIVKKQI